jgi:hypothetical protein
MDVLDEALAELIQKVNTTKANYTDNESGVAGSFDRIGPR